MNFGALDFVTFLRLPSARLESLAVANEKMNNLDL